MTEMSEGQQPEETEVIGELREGLSAVYWPDYPKDEDGQTISSKDALKQDNAFLQQLNRQGATIIATRQVSVTDVGIVDTMGDRVPKRVTKTQVIVNKASKQ